MKCVDEECSDNEQGISDMEDTDSEKEDEPTESGADGTVWQEKIQVIKLEEHWIRICFMKHPVQQDIKTLYSDNLQSKDK